MTFTSLFCDVIYDEPYSGFYTFRATQIKCATQIKDNTGGTWGTAAKRRGLPVQNPAMLHMHYLVMSPGEAVSLRRPGTASGDLRLVNLWFSRRSANWPLLFNLGSQSHRPASINNQDGHRANHNKAHGECTCNATVLISAPLPVCLHRTPMFLKRWRGGEAARQRVGGWGGGLLGGYCGRRLTERGHSLSQHCGYCRIAVVVFPRSSAPPLPPPRPRISGDSRQRAQDIASTSVNRWVDNMILCSDSDSCLNEVVKISKAGSIQGRRTRLLTGGEERVRANTLGREKIIIDGMGEGWERMGGNCTGNSGTMVVSSISEETSRGNGSTAVGEIGSWMIDGGVGGPIYLKPRCPSPTSSPPTCCELPRTTDQRACWVTNAAPHERKDPVP